MRWLHSMPLGPSVMPSCVVDASAFAKALIDHSGDGERLRRRLRSVRIAAPDYLPVEVASALRGRVAGGRLNPTRAAEALDRLAEAPFVRFDTRRLLGRIWELRDNLTTYDAGYVALAEALECPLITSDARISRAPGLRCVVEVV